LEEAICAAEWLSLSECWFASSKLGVGVSAMPDAYQNHQFRVSRQQEYERPDGTSYTSSSSTSFSQRDSNSAGADPLSIGIIGPDEERRTALVSALSGFPGGEVREFSSYPPALEDVPRLMERYYDVIIIDLDGDREYALELVEDICARDSATVMVYSANADQELVFRCMRAGAREFLFPPFDQATIVDALHRATSVPRQGSRQQKKARGRLMVCLGAKGGSGVTTIACNLAISIGQESAQSTLLIDLGLPMGDAALNLGIVTEFSTDNAFMDVDRLDATFLSKLLAKHRSGIFVLAAPSKVPKVQASDEAIDKLIKAARLQFENVIVDVGSRLDLMGTALFKEASTIFLVTQAGISELRNSNRVITEYFNQGSPKLEIVINRYDPRSLGLTDEHITKALNRPVQWKIPDDYAAARQMQNAASPQALADTPISRLIRQMSRSICGLPAIPEKTTGFRLRGLGRNLVEKIGATEDPTPVASSSVSVSSETPDIAWSVPEPITYGTRLNATQLDASASVPGTYAYAPAAGYVLPVGTHTLWVTFTPSDPPGATPVQTNVSITVNKATPTVNWPAPAAISCGVALSDKQLNAAASVPGTFVYSPAAGEVLSAGKHQLSVTFTPTDSANYATTEATAVVTVAKASPAVSWPTPAPIPCGTPLSEKQLNATATIPGIFVYASEVGDLLTVGKHTLSVTFTPNDVAGYTTAQATVVITVTRATPKIAWPAPAPITYGTRLSHSQLAATAAIAGTFTYTPGEGAMLAAGTHTPLVTFTPADPTSYTTAQAVTSLNVVPAQPIVTWETPAPVFEGTALSGAQLNARASVPGTFVYTPAAGELLPSGSHSLSVKFTPLDTENYTSVQASISISVRKPKPTMITWHAPSAISYGTSLSDRELNARASVPGSFVYTPAAGDVLTVGRHQITVAFTPSDTTEYAAAHATVAIEVEAPSIAASLLAPVADEPLKREVSEDFVMPQESHRGELVSISAGRNGTPETRMYKGAMYEKGEDGQWHLQRK
jgi:Flp pilus assembly CpaE family ATPase